LQVVENLAVFWHFEGRSRLVDSVVLEIDEYSGFGMIRRGATVTVSAVRMAMFSRIKWSTTWSI
jgi:hypothetical protein